MSCLLILCDKVVSCQYVPRLLYSGSLCTGTLCTGTLCLGILCPWPLCSGTYIRWLYDRGLYVRDDVIYVAKIDSNLLGEFVYGNVLITFLKIENAMTLTLLGSYKYIHRRPKSLSGTALGRLKKIMLIFLFRKEKKNNLRYVT